MGRLPTKEQWDRAADFTRHEWPAPQHAAVNRIDDGPLPIGDPADDDVTPEGVRDLFGNGTEFTRDLLKEGRRPAGRSEAGQPGRPARLVVRGAACDDL